MKARGRVASNWIFKDPSNLVEIWNWNRHYFLKYGKDRCNYFGPLGGIKNSTPHTPPFKNRESPWGSFRYFFKKNSCPKKNKNLPWVRTPEETQNRNQSKERKRPAEYFGHWKRWWKIGNESFQQPTARRDLIGGGIINLSEYLQRRALTGINSHTLRVSYIKNMVSAENVSCHNLLNDILKCSL